jgi:phosphatidylethanolamine/phosphatidyl-N-methylethanolamine N-methyltransferase
MGPRTRLVREMSVSANREFLAEFLRAPGRVGAIAPSSPDLARRMVSAVNAHEPSVVVEFGPGTGPFTEAILVKLAHGSQLIAIEQNDTFAALLRKKFPDLDLVHGSVESLPEILEARGGRPADCIVSGLPWASFDAALQRRILAAAVSGLREGGSFTTFAYVHGLVLPAAWRFRRLLEATFRQVRQSEIVWRNVPPAFVYHCRK